MTAPVRTRLGLTGLGPFSSRLDAIADAAERCGEGVYRATPLGAQPERRGGRAQTHANARGTVKIRHYLPFSFSSQILSLFFGGPALRWRARILGGTAHSSIATQEPKAKVACASGISKGETLLCAPRRIGGSPIAMGYDK